MTRWRKPIRVPGYVKITPEILFEQDPKDPERIRFFIHHDGFTDAKGERPGMQLVFSANPRSADYSPANFNRCMQELCSQAGVPTQQVPERSRLLRLRQKLIASYENAVGAAEH